MPDRPRRILPVPGLLDIDSVEDANVAEAFGQDEADDDSTPTDAPAEGLEAPPPDADPDGAPPTTDAPAAEPPVPPDPAVEAPSAEAEAPSAETSDVEAPAVEAPDAEVLSVEAVGADALDDPLGPPAPPPLEAPDTPLPAAGLDAESPEAPGEPPAPAPPDPGEGAEETPREPGDPAVVDPAAPSPGPTPPAEPGDPAAGLEAPKPPRAAPEPPPSAPEPAPPVAADEPPPAEGSDVRPALDVVSVETVEAAPVEAPRVLPVPSPEVVEAAKTVTRDRGKEFVQLVVRYGQAHVPEPPPKAEAADDGPPRMVGRVGQLIPFLRVIPWVLAALFAVSFWWDFDGQAVALLGQTLPLDGLLRVLTVSGLIGFGTNWLAITMLFQPREKRAIIPQGLIPAQRERVIYRLSSAISKELINADIIKQKIQASGVIGRYRDLAIGVVKGVVEDPAFRADLKRLAQDYAQEVLGSEPVRREVARLAVQKVEEQAGGGLGGVALRLYRTFAEDDFQRRVDRALDELPEAVAPLLDRIDVALDAVPPRVEAHADEIEEAATKAVLSFVEGFDVRSMISERARQFDEGQLEGLLKSTSNEQLNYIKYLGAILGVFGGFVIWQPVGALVVFGTAALLLWGLDEALVRARRAKA